MIDFIKTNGVKGVSPAELLNNKLLEFETPIVEKTGELKENRKVAKYRHLTFEIVNNKYINLTGSLHKYCHKGRNNTDFTFTDLKNVLIDLKEKFGINLERSRIHNLEFGVNVSLPFSPQLFIDTLIVHKGAQYELHPFDGRGLMKKFPKSCYEIKVYDKGRQYFEEGHKLRFEIKVKKMAQLEHLEIFYLSDLLNEKKMQGLWKELLYYFKGFIIYDNSIDEDELDDKERDIILNGSNPRYWANLKKAGHRKYEYFRVKFLNELKKHGKANLGKDIKILILRKWIDLLKSRSSSLDLKKTMNFKNRGFIYSGKALNPREMSDEKLSEYRKLFPPTNILAALMYEVKIYERCGDTEMADETKRLVDVLLLKNEIVAKKKLLSQKRDWRRTAE